ncbi:MAG: protein kinase, partial [Planctomycetota bacterium]|nr:protein kinase [Planctomycetota bacterium]
SGAISSEQLQDCLEYQKRSTVLRCPQCNTNYRIGSWDPSRKYLCKKPGCGAQLGGSSSSNVTQVATAPQSSITARELLSGLPDDVREAAKTPANWVGKYLLVTELGRGGMGVVYRAFDTKLKRHVAIKFLFGDSTKSQSEGSAEVERFFQEAQISAQLVHPNIPQIFEIAENEGRHMIVMELIEGGPASCGKRLPLKKALFIMHEVARAIDYAHSLKFVHRDIKPSNILLDKGGKAYIMDFGLAKSQTVSKKLTISGSVVGTPSYMPPEQALGRLREIDARSDVYSLGATLYELITGRAPFTARTPVEVLQRVIDSEPPPMSSIVHGLSRDVETVCAKAMEKEKGRRYASAAEFADELKRLMDGQHVLAEPPSFATLLVRKAKKNKPVVTVGMVAAVALVVFLAWLLVVKRHAAEQERTSAVDLQKMDAEREREAQARKSAEDEKARIAAEQEAAKKARTDAQRDFDAGAKKLEEARLDFYRPGANLAKTAVRIREAIDHFAQAITICPKYHEAFHQRGRAHLWLFEYEAARKDFDDAVGIVLDFAIALLDRGKLQLAEYIEMTDPTSWYEETDDTGPARQKLKGALADFEAARKAGMAEVETELAGAYAAYARGDYAETEAISGRVLSLDESREEALKLRADARFWGALEASKTSLDAGRKSYEDAIADYTAAIEMRANYVEAYKMRGVARFEIARIEAHLGNKEKSATEIEAGRVDMEKAIAVQPDYEPALTALGIYWMRMNDADKAYDLADRAVQSRPKSFLALNLRGHIKGYKNDFSGAVDDFNHALAENPKYLPAKFNRGAVQLKWGKYSEALEDFEECKRLSPRTIKNLDEYIEAARQRVGK